MVEIGEIQTKDGPVIAKAVLHGEYRYVLHREWSSGPTCVFIMLNPSTADGTRDDPTIRRCMAFARREGCGSLQVVNLYAFRATSPDDLFKAENPIGPYNDGWIDATVAEADGPIIAGWGSRAARMGRDVDVLSRILKPYRIQCLGRTATMNPRHPLYVRGDHPLFEYSPAGVSV